MDAERRRTVTTLRRLSLTIAAVLTFTSHTSSPRGEVVEFQHGRNDYLGGQDATIFSGPWVNHSSGAASWLFLGTSDATEARRGLIRFLLPPWLATREILSAELVLHVDSINEEAEGEVSYRVHRLLQGWGEGESDQQDIGLDRGVPASTGEATWLSNRHNQSTWTTAGGHFLLLDSGSDTIPVDTGRVLRITGPRMADDVTIWLSRPDANHGWLIVGDESRLYTDVRVRSTEYANPQEPNQGLTTRPMLRLVLAATPTPTPTATPTPTPTATPAPTTAPRVAVIEVLLSRRPAATAQDRNGDLRIDAADVIGLGVL